MARIKSPPQGHKGNCIWRISGCHIEEKKGAWEYDSMYSATLKALHVKWRKSPQRSKFQGQLGDIEESKMCNHADVHMLTHMNIGTGHCLNIDPRKIVWTIRCHYKIASCMKTYRQIQTIKFRNYTMPSTKQEFSWGILARCNYQRRSQHWKTCGMTCGLLCRTLTSNPGHVPGKGKEKLAFYRERRAMLVETQIGIYQLRSHHECM